MCRTSVARIMKRVLMLVATVSSARRTVSVEHANNSLEKKGDKTSHAQPSFGTRQQSDISLSGRSRMEPVADSMQFDDAFGSSLSKK